MLQKFWARASCWGQAAAPIMDANAQMSTSSHLTNVWCPWATTLKFSPNIYSPNLSYGPKYRPRDPHSNGNIGPRKTQKSVFAKMAAKTTSGSGFHFIFRFSVVDLVYNATNLEIASLTLFREISPQSWKIQKIFKWVTWISHGEIFDMLRPLWPSTTVPKFTNFHQGINFL